VKSLLKKIKSLERKLNKKRQDLIDSYFDLTKAYARIGNNSQIDSNLNNLIEFVNYGEESERLVDFCIDNEIGDRLILLYEKKGRSIRCSYIKEKMMRLEEAVEDYIRVGAYDDALRVAFKVLDESVKNRLVNKALDSIDNYSDALRMAKKYAVDEIEIDLRGKREQFRHYHLQ